MTKRDKKPPSDNQIVNFWHFQKEQTAQRYQIQQGTPPNLPEIFNASGMALLPTCMPLQHAVNGMQNAASGADQWQRPEGRPPFYTGTSKVGSTMVEYNDLDPSVTMDVWEQVKSFTDLDVDVLLATLAQILTSSGKQDKYGTWIYADQILDYRGIKPITRNDGSGGKPQRHGHRQEDINDITRCMHRLSNLWVTVAQQIREEAPERTATGRKKKAKKKELTLRSRLLIITSMLYQRELHNEPIPPDATPIGWHVRLGDWIAPFLEGANKQIGFLCQQALKYDPYHELWEKRLARYFLFHMRMNGRIGVVNREIGPLLETLSLPIDARFPDRNTKQRFEKAMNRLVDDKQIDGWEYAEDVILPARGWLPTWLNQNVTIYFAPYKPPFTTNAQEVQV